MVVSDFPATTALNKRQCLSVQRSTIDKMRLPDLFARPLATPQNGLRLLLVLVKWQKTNIAVCLRRKSQRDSSHQLWQLLHNPGNKDVSILLGVICKYIIPYPIVHLECRCIFYMLKCSKNREAPVASVLEHHDCSSATFPQLTPPWMDGSAQYEPELRM